MKSNHSNDNKGIEICPQLDKYDLDTNFSAKDFDDVDFKTFVLSYEEEYAGRIDGFQPCYFINSYAKLSEQCSLGVKYSDVMGVSEAETPDECGTAIKAINNLLQLIYNQDKKDAYEAYYLIVGGLYITQ